MDFDTLKEVDVRTVAPDSLVDIKEMEAVKAGKAGVHLCSGIW